MDERFSLYDIARILSEKTGIEQPGTEKFIDELISIINEGVRQDGVVKVRGLGVFKVLLLKERESVHVSTGERIVIPEHHKLAFIPEKELKILVNKPFSAFEAELISNPSPEGSLVTDVRYENTESANVQTPPNEPDVPNEETTYLPPSPADRESEFETPPPAEELQPEQIKPEDETVLIQNHPAEETPAEENTVLLPPPPREDAQPQENTTLITEHLHEAETATTLQEATKDDETSLVIPIRPEAPPPPPLVKDETVVAPPKDLPWPWDDDETPEPPTPPTPKKKKKPLWPLYVILIVLLLIFCGCIWYLVSDRTLSFFNHNPDMVVSGESFALPGDSIAIREGQEKAKSAIPSDSTSLSPDTTAVKPSTPASTTKTIPSSPAEKKSTGKPATSKPTAPTTSPAASNSKVIAKVKMTAGQRLTLLALEYYGNKMFWVYIYEYNKSKIGSNPNVIPVGMELSIPAKNVYGIDANNAASVEKARQLQAEIVSRLQQSYSYY
jgi:nucleoid DNA-binding protein